MKKQDLSRRNFMKAGLGIVAGSSVLAGQSFGEKGEKYDKGVTLNPGMRHGGHQNMPHTTKKSNPFKDGEMDPMKFLNTFDYGKVTQLPGGETQREYTIIALDKEVEVAPGVKYPAWTYNGYVPGPTLRATEGDRLKINFANASHMPHTIHFHGIHPGNMDGVFEQVPVGGSFVYEFPADPFGVFLYHCHSMPLKKHVEKGLYGAFIVDPENPRPPAKELIMVMNGFDTDFDGENEFYTVNGYANYFSDNPINIKVGELVRIYLVNLTEFDLINSFHLHGNMFRLYRTGTNVDQYEYTDTVMLCQGERCIIEFSYKYPGMYMFHAHQSEFAELGWMGFFNVLPEVA
ncbi:MAG: multicopper oxidase domain-containing protein [Thermodesulfobacteriota bacterium]